MSNGTKVKWIGSEKDLFDSTKATVDILCEEKALTEKHEEENNEKEDTARLCGSGCGCWHIAGTGARFSTTLAAWINWALHGWTMA